MKLADALLFVSRWAYMDSKEDAMMFCHGLDLLDNSEKDALVMSLCHVTLAYATAQGNNEHKQVSEVLAAMLDAARKIDEEMTDEHQ